MTDPIKLPDGETVSVKELRHDNETGIAFYREATEEDLRAAGWVPKEEREALEAKLRDYMDTEADLAAKDRRIEEMGADMLRVAHATGIVNAPDSGPCWPGPIEDIVTAIETFAQGHREAEELREVLREECSGLSEVAGERDAAVATLAAIRGLVSPDPAIVYTAPVQVGPKLRASDIPRGMSADDVLPPDAVDALSTPSNSASGKGLTPSARLDRNGSNEGQAGSLKQRVAGSDCGDFLQSPPATTAEPEYTVGFGVGTRKLERQANGDLAARYTFRREPADAPAHTPASLPTSEADVREFLTAKTETTLTGDRLVPPATPEGDGDEAPRCEYVASKISPSTSRCQRRAGHDGVHVSGSIRWASPEQPKLSREAELLATSERKRKAQRREIRRLNAKVVRWNLEIRQAWSECGINTRTAYARRDEALARLTTAEAERDALAKELALLGDTKEARLARDRKLQEERDAAIARAERAEAQRPALLGLVVAVWDWRAGATGCEERLGRAYDSLPGAILAEVGAGFCLSPEPPQQPDRTAKMSKALDDVLELLDEGKAKAATYRLLSVVRELVEKIK